MTPAEQAAMVLAFARSGKRRAPSMLATAADVERGDVCERCGRRVDYRDRCGWCSTMEAR